LVALRTKWLPQSEEDDDLGTALYLENQYWENMQIAVANGIGKALNG
jgi:hypothetical protein|tara:strand:- start:893 stop:1033 length:141 start_codon:yes stop_codon:yes gene_type:complete